MDFYDLHAVGEAGSKPTIKTTQKSVLITLPNHLVERAGLPQGGKVRVQLGEAGRARTIRISAAADSSSGWDLTVRKNVAQLFVREIMPKAAVIQTDVPFHMGDGSLDLTLPTPWELADPHVVIRSRAAQARRSGADRE